MKQLIQLVAALAISFLPPLLLTGCKTVARETIISSVNTGIGISLAQNPKSEMYEVKIGYIRSQFYSVPTGKTVEDSCTNGVHHTNRADITPDVLSGIRVQSSAKQLFLGVDISESFAVGSNAVWSPAAVVMYVAQAESDAKAVAASQAVGGVRFEEDDTARQIRAWIWPQGPRNPPAASNLGELKTWMAGHRLGNIKVERFLEEKKYAVDRAQAISDLNIPAPPRS